MPQTVALGGGVVARYYLTSKNKKLPTHPTHPNAEAVFWLIDPEDTILGFSAPSTSSFDWGTMTSSAMITVDSSSDTNTPTDVGLEVRGGIANIVLNSPPDLSADSWTLEHWMMNRGISSRTHLRIYASASRHLMILSYNSYARVYHNGTMTQVPFPTPLVDHVWSHVAFVYDKPNQEFTVYIDGVGNTVSMDLDATYNANTSADWSITLDGTYTGVPYTYFHQYQLLPSLKYTGDFTPSTTLS